MAVTIRDTTRSGRRTFVIDIDEENVAAGTEIEVAGVPFDVGQLTHLQATLIAGTATKITPGAGRITGYAASSQDEVFQLAAASGAAHINEQSFAKFEGLLGKLWVKPQPDAGADNHVQMRLTLVEGHQS